MEILGKVEEFGVFGVRKNDEANACAVIRGIDKLASN